MLMVVDTDVTVTGGVGKVSNQAGLADRRLTLQQHWKRSAGNVTSGIFKANEGPASEPVQRQN